MVFLLQAILFFTCFPFIKRAKTKEKEGTMEERRERWIREEEEERIRVRAYFLWKDGNNKDALKNWLDAKKIEQEKDAKDIEWWTASFLRWSAYKELMELKVQEQRTLLQKIESIKMMQHM